MDGKSEIQMTGVSVKFENAFPAAPKGYKIYKSNRDNIDSTRLSSEESGAVDAVMDSMINGLGRVNGLIANIVSSQRGYAQAFAAIAKAKIPNNKPINYPSQANTLGIIPLIPQWFNYTSTPSSTLPSYTSYTLNSWNISTTAGTAAYIMGDGTNYYKGKPTSGSAIENFVFDKGLIEIGVTPKINQFRAWSQNETKYGVVSETVLYDQPIDPQRQIYMHNTPLGAMILTHDFGFMWKFMPEVTGTINLRLLGLSVYEHEFSTDVAWST